MGYLGCEHRFSPPERTRAEYPAQAMKDDSPSSFHSSSSAPNVKSGRSDIQLGEFADLQMFNSGLHAARSRSGIHLDKLPDRVPPILVVLSPFHY